MLLLDYLGVAIAIISCDIRLLGCPHLLGCYFGSRGCRSALRGSSESDSRMLREGDEVGLLLQSLYGTRDASANFQEEIRKGVQKEI